MIGGGNRTSPDMPLGAGFGSVRDGYNQRWDLGAGLANNRVSLDANNGVWPNVLTIKRTTAHDVVQGAAMPITFHYQWAKPETETASVAVYLDSDFNPINGNEKLLQTMNIPGSGAVSVHRVTTNLVVSASSAGSGTYAILTSITAENRNRYLYAPESVTVTSTPLPELQISRSVDNSIQIDVIGMPAQTVVLQTSLDLHTWTAVATNTLAAGRWAFTNALTFSWSEVYFRAVVP
jgi:hypothetical protein